jgi:type III secretory pathway component EscU
VALVKLEEVVVVLAELDELVVALAEEVLLLVVKLGVVMVVPGMCMCCFAVVVYLGCVVSLDSVPSPFRHISRFCRLFRFLMMN